MNQFSSPFELETDGEHTGEVRYKANGSSLLKLDPLCQTDEIICQIFVITYRLTTSLRVVVKSPACIRT